MKKNKSNKQRRKKYHVRVFRGLRTSLRNKRTRRAAGIFPNENVRYRVVLHTLVCASNLRHRHYRHYHHHHRRGCRHRRRDRGHLLPGLPSKWPMRRRRSRVFIYLPRDRRALVRLTCLTTCPCVHRVCEFNTTNYHYRVNSAASYCFHLSTFRSSSSCRRRRCRL